ncbi:MULTISPECIES: DUF742 domain-containing protein [unclassified Streptosporangium]|uniref:DUF742 domain-containing protein n=1 Tax=unclassified Streptosporangium TaxID=2632669 RepID=UPI002E27AC28|nr:MULTISPECIES: DUF742 domain-containing protein [unclassified Streptosporangium]
MRADNRDRGQGLHDGRAFPWDERWEDTPRYGFPAEPSGETPEVASSVPPTGAEPPRYGSPGETPGSGARRDGRFGYEPEHDEPADEESSLVRMYAVTGGRVVPSSRLAMEALVSTTTTAPLGLSYVREYRFISDLCRSIRSIAEISALLSVPLGVTRVLVSDMESEGLVRIHHPRVTAAGPGPDLLERVLNHLRG